MNNVSVKCVDMPGSVRACVVRSFDDDEYYTIMINARLSDVQQREAYRHEVNHLQHDDFSCKKNADFIERVRHYDKGTR